MAFMVRVRGGLQLSNLNKKYYGYKLDNEVNKNWFKILHKFSPLLKWIALVLFMIAPFKGWFYFNIALALFVLSLIINNIKWKFNYSFEYILYENNLKVVKSYNLFKFKEIFKIDISKIKSCEIITPEQMPEKNVIIAFNKLYPMEFILKIKRGIERDVIITVDKYLYSVIMEAMKEKDKEIF